MARCRQILRTTVAGLLVLVQSSCFTLAVWGFEPHEKRNPVTGREDTTFRYDDDTEWSWPLFFGRVLITPITFCLDCLTAPVQAWWFDDDDDDRSRRPPCL